MFRPGLVLVRSGLALAAVAGVSLVFRSWLPVAPTTVALTYLVGIVVVATWWGLAPATAASVGAMLCFNIFFLPPIGTITIADPQNWISFVAFMVTAIIVSQLSGRARDRQMDAVARQNDLERLYALSRALLLVEANGSLPAQMAQRVTTAFGVASVGLYDRRSDRVAWGGAERAGVDERLREVARTGEVVHDRSGVVVAPIRLGGAPIGALALEGAPGDAVLQSIVNLVAIGLERARSQEAMARVEAARRSGELRGALLDAIAHEFKTPLTAGKAAASALLSAVDTDDRDQELIVIVNEELDRLQALVSDAIHMLRIDAGDVVVRAERQRVEDLVQQAVRDMGSRLEGRTCTVDVPSGIIVDADGSLVRLAIRQVLDNAVKYSPPESLIAIDAAVDGPWLRVRVRNTGPAIPVVDRDHLFERFYRGSLSANVPGSGLGLAIVQRIVRAHGGEVAVTSEPQAGTTFTLSLPMVASAAPAA